MEEVKICKHLEEESSSFDTSLKFKAEFHLQTAFVNSEYFQIDSTMVYKLDRVEEIYKHELIYNGNYLLVLAKLSNSIKPHLLIYKPPQGRSAKVLKACKEFEITMNCSTNFVLHYGGNTIAFNHNYYDQQDKTLFYQIILDLSLSIESRVSDISNVVLRYNCNYTMSGYGYGSCYAISGDLLAITFIVDNKKQVVSSYNYPGYESQSNFVKVLDCSAEITEVFCINKRKIFQYGFIKDLCFLDNNKLAIITSCFEYITIDIRSGVREVKEINFLPTVDNLHHYVKSFFNIRYESIDNGIVLIVTDTGFILNLNKEKCISLIDKIQQNQNINIVSIQLCIFNKWIYIFCKNFVLYVYDPFHEVVVHEFSAVRHGLSTEIMDVWFKKKICIDWFGEQLFYNTKDKIIIEQIFRHKCFSLRYIARKALFKYHSENELKKLKLGKKINQLIFDNIY